MHWRPRRHRWRLVSVDHPNEGYVVELADLGIFLGGLGLFFLGIGMLWGVTEYRDKGKAE